MLGTAAVQVRDHLNHLNLEGGQVNSCVASHIVYATDDLKLGSMSLSSEVDVPEEEETVLQHLEKLREDAVMVN
jgi:hypothetical protein